MDWSRFRAAIIRFFWATVFPMIGVDVVYFIEPENLEKVGVTNGIAALVIGGVLYGLKKLLWPDTVL